MDLIEFSKDVLRPINMALSFICSIWFLLYLSRDWSKIPSHFKRISLVLLLLLFATVFGTTEQYLQDVAGGWRIYITTAAMLGMTHVMINAIRTRRRAGTGISEP